MLVAAPSPDCLLLLRLLVNNFINSSFSVTPLKVQSVLGLGLSYVKSYFELGFPDIAIKNTGCLLKFEFYVTFFSVSMSHVVCMRIHLSISIYLLYHINYWGIVLYVSCSVWDILFTKI